MPQVFIGSTETGDAPACVISFPDDMPPEEMSGHIDAIWEQQTPEGSVQSWVASEEPAVAASLGKARKLPTRQRADLTLSAPPVIGRPQRPTRPAK